MRKIYAIGETLLDIILRDGQPQAARAGGSMLNSVVSLGRLSLPVSFISEYGCDDLGIFIDNFLKKNGVNTSFVHRYNDGNTALALAFLDEKNDAHYTFYKNYPAKRLEIEFPLITKEDIILCGSFYAISTEIREKFISFLQSAKDIGAIILYDPNFRTSHLNELEILRPLIIENMQLSTIIRGSREDFMNIFGAGNPDDAWHIVREYCRCMVYTASTDGVSVRTSSFSGEYPVRKIVPLSTIGAGDNFNAGMLVSFYGNNIFGINIGKMDNKEWEKVIKMAVDFATNVCMSYDNYISEEFAREI